MIRTIGLTSISYLALAGFFGLLALAVFAITQKLFKTTILTKIRLFVAPRSYAIGFVLSLVATFSSLFLSEVLHFAPCILCWYQRIALYPQTVLLYMALIRRERTLTPYLIVLNGIGLVVALYHYSLHIVPRTIATILPCSTAFGGVPCDKGYHMYFGFMTFPLMAAVVFALLIFVFSCTPKLKKKHG